MPLIPLFLQSEVLDDNDNLLSAFNFCDPFDHILPFPDNEINADDRAHLWGLFTGIPIGDVVSPSGGWDFMMQFEHFRTKRDREAEERKRIQQEIEAIANETDREIAKILQSDLAIEARDKELKDLETLVATTFRNDDMAKAEAHGVAKAFARAAVQSNRSAMEALEREMDRAREDEDFLLLAMVILG